MAPAHIDVHSILPENWTPLTPAQLAELKSIDSPTVANAIESFKCRPRVEGYVGSGVRCLIPGMGSMLGYAVTVRGDSTTESRMGPEHRPALYSAVYQISQLSPDSSSPLPVVVVIGDGGDPMKLDLSCHAGEIMATSMKRCGAVGLVSDGGLRDVKEVEALGGLHYFGRGLVVSHGRPIIYDVGATLNINGMTVRTGDLLHGDENGVVIIPREIAGQVYEESLRIREHEAKLLEKIRADDFLEHFGAAPAAAYK